MNRLIIIGAGGHGKVIADAALKNGYTNICYIDDHATGDVMGFPIIGTTADIECLNDGSMDFIIGMLSYYLNQIMLAEINGKIAFILNSASVSVDSSPCDVTWRINNDEIEDYLLQIPSYKRNGQIKEIIRKHLNAQGVLITGFSVPIETKQPKAKKERKIEKQSRKRLAPPAQEKTKEEFVQTDEERDAIMALIAMGGE